MPRAEAYGSSFVCLFVCLSVIMPRAELRRHTVIVLSVSQSVFYKYFSSLTENKALKLAKQADIDICSDLIEGSDTPEISYTVGRNPTRNPKSKAKSRNPTRNLEIQTKSRNPI